MVACYVRVSTDLQVNEGYSIGEQTDRLQKYCEAMNWTDIKLYTDGGFSGANMDRPALQRLIKDVKDGKIEKVIVYKLDRLSRSQKDTLYLIEDVFLANGCDFVSMNENFDTSTPFGKAMIGILSVFAQLEREQIKERLKMGKTARAKTGLYHGGGYIPIGYDYDNGLIVNEYEAEQVRMVFDMFNEGKAPSEIAEYMNDRGYKTKYGVWSHDTVYKLIPKKLFLGVLEYKGEEYAGSHEPIITQEQWETAQRIRENRGQKDRRFRKNSSYLGGICYCGICGEKYRLKTQKYKSPVQGTVKYYRYMCKNFDSSYSGHKCNNKTYSRDDLENLIFEQIKLLKLEPIQFTTKAIKNPNSRQIERLTRQIDKLIDLYSLGDIPQDVLQDKIKNLNDQISTLKEEQDRIEAESKKINEQTIQMINSLESILESDDINRIRALINALISKIVIDGDDVSIFWRFS